MSIRIKLNLQSQDWSRIGYGVSALWMMGVLFYTEGDTRHPYFQFIFIVPLAGWVLALAIGYLIRRYRQKSD